MLKRTLDLLISLLAAVLLLPLMIVIAILIRFDSPGPAFFIQERLGLGGAPFRMYKFRTMTVNAEKNGTGLFSYENDPRVTRIGKHLRRLSFDEFPQLINVLRGEMSIVGPRPPVTYELGNYADLPPLKRIRFQVKPGITGLAQVSGRNALDWDTKIAFDNRYVALSRRYGVLLDMWLICMTIWVVICMRDVVEIQKGSVSATSRTV